MDLSFFKAPKDQVVPQPLNVRFAILTFSIFYFFRWFYGNMTPYEWVTQISAYLVFLVLYFMAYRKVEWVVPIGFGMLALSIVIAPQNYGSNTFAIFAVNSFVYNLPMRRAVFFMLLAVFIMTVATFTLGLEPVGYLAVGACISLAMGFIGVVTRQQYMHMCKQQKTQAEISRLAKIAERERIGQDLHDLLGHSLTAIHLKSELCLQHWEASQWQALKNELLTIRDTAKQSIKEVREAVTDCKKHNLHQELTSQQAFLQTQGITLNYQLPNTVLPPALESDLLMIVREALTNVLRHAKANKCNIECSANNNGVQLHITDNGKGLAPGHKVFTGSGLLGIKQRTEARGGHFEVQHNPGVTLELFLPWQSNELAQAHA